MGLLQERMSKYREPQKYINAGVYPYFREIDSHQDTEVMMSGKRVLMFGSNSYMGLTYDKRICEAAINAIKKYGTGCAGSRFLNGTSMEGDLAKLPEIIALKKKYNATVMVDEAHGLGVFGKQGRGVCNHFGVTDDVDLIMGTFSKSLASIGGFIASDSDTINWLRHNSRTYIFSASNTPAATAAALEAIHILKSEPERQENLWKTTNYALEQFKQAGFEIGDTESPIIPLYVRDAFKTFQVTKMAFDKGVFVNSVVPPACAPQDTLIRVALMATHTKEQVDRCVAILVDTFKELGLLK